MNPTTIPGGYAGRIARFELTHQALSELPWKEGEILPVIGGRGLAASLLYRLLPLGVNPLSPENLLIFAVGPFAGTNVPFSGRWSVASKSPLTGITGSGNGGGNFGAALKCAGLDAVVISGKAGSLSYLLIDEGRFSLRGADHLLGKSPEETAFAIRSEIGDPSVGVAAIGQAGEEGTLLATILSDHHAAGRGGLGAVMGSKNLKAVAVRGNRKVNIFDQPTLDRMARGIVDTLVTQKYYASYLKYGSSSAVKNRYGTLGGGLAFNGQNGVCPHLDAIDGDSLFPYLSGSESCHSCPVPCSKSFTVKEGKYAPVKGKGVQTATAIGFGIQCGMSDIAAMLKAHARVNHYGLDLISAPVVIAFAMECYQRRIISKESTGGLDLSWENANDAVLESIELMGQNEGFGKTLNRGVKALSKEWGEETRAFAFHVKGLETTPVDGRVYPSWALGYAVSSRGGDHMRSYSLAEFGELTDELVERIAGTKEAADPRGTKGKGKMVAYFEDVRALADSLPLCKFPARGHFGFPENLTGLFRVVTGLDWSADDLRRAGERIVQMERLFNLREGLTPADDTLPERYLSEPVHDGPAKGRVVNLAPMLEEYYQVRGWDRKTGRPRADRLRDLKLMADTEK